ncbi:MAG: Uma2 family endonuclease [Myxococcaceae bacterium]|nr:Uma2 family endonuclease [Myxococcaceae bacterium]
METPLSLLRALPIRYPVELMPPSGFVPARLETWPSVDGRLEFVEGKLLYLPPCADEQSEVVSGVVYELVSWVRQHPEFVVATNEAGMLLKGAVRAADAAVWRKDSTHVHGTLRRVPPILAVEVAGEEDTVASLRHKARWYVTHGVEVVWLVFPTERFVKVVSRSSTRTFHPGDALPAARSLPGLAPRVRDLFFQLG